MNISLSLEIPFILLGLVRNKRLNLEDIERLQSKKLRKLIKHSYDNVDYYHRLFKRSHLSPEDIRTIEDLDKIPISRKTDFAGLELKERTASNIDLSKCLERRTSGSSGIGLQCYREKKTSVVNLLRNYLWQLEVGDRISNRHVDLGGHWVPNHPFERLRIFPTKRISPFLDVGAQIKQIVDYHPKTILGLPSAIRILAKELKSHLYDITIPLIFTGGELLDEHTRQLAQESFDGEVFDSYGMIEVGGISKECYTHNGYHVWSDLVFLETVRNGNRVSPGEHGDIVVTGLVNHATPIIRYNSEDTGILMDDECSCGSHFPLMRITEGRKSDTILLCDGKSVAAHAVCAGLCEIYDIKQFQVIQDGIGHFVVKVVKESGFNDTTLESITQVFRKTIGKVSVDILLVDDIPRLESGKFKQFIIKIRQS